MRILATARSCALTLAGVLWLSRVVACHDPQGLQPPTTQVADSGATYFPGIAWRTAEPSAVGLNAAAIQRLRRDVAGSRYGSIDGVLIVRYGHLAFEQYNWWSPDRAHTMQSVTKSVTSLLFGILQQKTAPETSDLDRPVVDVFQRYAPIENLDDRKRALTLRHLITMRTGMDFWEQPYGGSPLDQLNRSTGDWAKFVLDRPMTSAPGVVWAYNSGAAILMGAAIRELAHEPTDAFARRELFDQIGASGAYWVQSPFDGLPHCGGGLFLRPSDLARIGYLVLRHGRWGARQLVRASWIDSSTTAASRGAELIFSAFGAGYGDFWWLFPSQRGGTQLDVIAASGSGGQWLFVVPRLDLVVVVVASNGAGLDMLYDGILPAVQ